MNNDFDLIEKFLHKISAMAKENIPVTLENVYVNLVRINSNGEKINNFFGLWINEFKDIDNIQVFINEDSNYYCNFVNYEVDKKIDPYKMIKIYLAQDDKHIYETVCKLFKFMALNNIKHHSKVASMIRNDSIVIRVYDMADALKVQNFIMNDDYIMEGIIRSNPFTCNNGSIAYVWDGHLSFNQILAAYISGYINKLKKDKKLDTACFKDFLDYVDYAYNYGFLQNKNIIKLLNVSGNSGINMALYYEDFKKISKMLLLNLGSKDKDIDDFYHNYNKIVLNNVINEVSKDISIYQEMWNNIYKRLVKKHGYKVADFMILSFIRSNDYTWFTRDDNIREYIIKNGLTASMLWNLISNMYEKNEHRKILVDALVDTYKKYDYEQTVAALKEALLGNYKLFTNDKNGRTKLKNNIDCHEIYGLMAYELINRGYIIDDDSLREDIIMNSYLDMVTNRKVSG